MAGARNVRSWIEDRHLVEVKDVASVAGVADMGLSIGKLAARGNSAERRGAKSEFSGLVHRVRQANLLDHRPRAYAVKAVLITVGMAATAAAVIVLNHTWWAASMPATISADPSGLVFGTPPRFQDLMSDGPPERLQVRRPRTTVERCVRTLPSFLRQLGRGRSLTPRQACDDVTTTTHLRPTGLHAGPRGREVAGLLRDHQLRDMPGSVHSC